MTKKPSFLPGNAGWVLPSSFVPFASSIGAMPPPAFNLEDLLGRYRSLETQLAFLPPVELAARWIMPLLEALGYGLYPNTSREKGFPDALLFESPALLNTHLRSRSIDSAWRQGEGVALVAGRSQRAFEEQDDLPDSATFGSAPLTRFLALDATEGKYGLVTNGLIWRIQSFEHPTAFLELDSTQLWERRDRAGLAEFAKWIHPGRLNRLEAEGYHAVMVQDLAARGRILERCRAHAMPALALLNRGFLASLRKHKVPLSAADRRRAAWAMARLTAFKTAESDWKRELQASPVPEWILHSDLRRAFALSRWPLEALKPASGEWEAAFGLLTGHVWEDCRRLRTKERAGFWEEVLRMPLIEAGEALALQPVEEGTLALRPVAGAALPPLINAGEFYPEPSGDIAARISLVEACFSAHLRRIASEWPVGEHLASSKEAVREEIVREKGLGRKKALHDYQKLRQQAFQSVLDHAWLQWECGTGIGMIRMADSLARRLMREEAFPCAEEGAQPGYAWLTATLLQRCIYGSDRDPALVEVARHFLSEWSGTPADRLLVRTGNPLLGAHPARLGDVAPDAASLATRQAHQGSFVEFEFRDRIRAVLSDFETLDALGGLPGSNGSEEGLRQRLSMLSRRFETLASLWLLTQGGRGISAEAYQALLDHLKDSAPEWEAAVLGFEEALDQAGRLGFLHWPLAFPERFFEAGRTKPDGGFDWIWLGLPLTGGCNDAKRYYKPVARVHRNAARNVTPEGWCVIHRLWECLRPNGEAEWPLTAEEFEEMFPKGVPAGRQGLEAGREVFLLNLQTFHRPDPVPQPEFKPVLRLVILR